MFIAMNANIENQFEYLQRRANGSEIGEGDDLIRQTPPVPRTYRTQWGAPAMTERATTFPRTVTMRGGEYFFLPSMAFLKSV